MTEILAALLDLIDADDAESGYQPVPPASSAEIASTRADVLDAFGCQFPDEYYELLARRDGASSAFQRRSLCRCRGEMRNCRVALPRVQIQDRRSAFVLHAIDGRLEFGLAIGAQRTNQLKVVPRGQGTQRRKVE